MLTFAQKQKVPQKTTSTKTTIFGRVRLLAPSVPLRPSQTRLKADGPGDAYELEADRIADQVMASPEHHTVSGVPRHIQRFSGRSNGPMDALPPSVDQALASAGRPLEPALRQQMEQRFGHDFSRVRVHSGAAAERSARDVNANAYTLGRNIVFGADRFAPGTPQGGALLAHELTHVIQQGGGNPGVGAPVAVQRQPVASPSSTGRALYPTAGERADIQEVLNPLATKAPQGAAPPVTDPDGFKAAMQARMKPYIDMVVAAAHEREAASVSLSQGVIESLA